MVSRRRNCCTADLISGRVWVEKKRRSSCSSVIGVALPLSDAEEEDEVMEYDVGAVGVTEETLATSLDL